MPERAARNAERASTDIRGHVAALGVHVDDLRDDVRNLRGEFRTLQGSMASADDLRGLDRKLDQLGSRFAEKSTTPWTTITSFASLAIVIGYAWISSQTGPLKETSERLATEATYFRKEVAAEFKETRGLVVSRGEHEQRWANSAEQMRNLQRQIDDNAKAFGSTYSLRDALAELQKRIERIETHKGT